MAKTPRDHISELHAVTSRSDEFRTDCSRLMSQAGRPANSTLQLDQPRVNNTGNEHLSQQGINLHQAEFNSIVPTRHDSV